MAETKGKFPNGLASAMEAKGIGPTELARLAGETTKQNLVRYRDQERKLPVELAKTLAPLLEVTAEQLILGTPPSSIPAKTIRPSGPEPTEVVKVGEGWPDVGDEWMDVRGVTVGGDDSFFYFGDVIDQVRRPPGIRNAKNVAALNVAGESMLERFQPGELIYIQLREPAPGDDVVVELHPEDEGDAPKSFLKRLVRKSGRQIECLQLNPRAEINFDRGEVANLWRVLTLRDLLG
jgi:phage repressor protein C with HTH and peptisase S24 domain